MIAPRTIHYFPLGQLLATQAALDALESCGLSPMYCVIRHLRNDWGDVSLADWSLNNEAAENGGRILSAYELASGARVWVITEADRSATTILLPDEY